MILGFLDAVLTCAFVILIAFILVWLWQTFVGGIDGNVMKWGRIVVGLICIIIIVGFLLSLVAGPGSGPYPHHFIGRMF